MSKFKYDNYDWDVIEQVTIPNLKEIKKFFKTLTKANMINEEWYIDSDLDATIHIIRCLLADYKKVK